MGGSYIRNACPVWKMIWDKSKGRVVPFPSFLEQTCKKNKNLIGSNQATIFQMATEKTVGYSKNYKVIYNQRSICLLTTIFTAQTSPWSQLPHENHPRHPQGNEKVPLPAWPRACCPSAWPRRSLELELVRCISSHSSWVQEHLLSKNRGQVKIGFLHFYGSMGLSYTYLYI